VLDAVFDSTVLVSAFLSPRGVSNALLHRGREETFQLYLSADILDETRRVLLEEVHIRKRYPYTDDDVEEFVTVLRETAFVIPIPAQFERICRDPNDDMVLACALAARVPYLVSRDKDLLTLKTYKETSILTPEAFMYLLRSRPSTS
jgi:putative PIN family toxin of toxin-antitoxin system